MDLPPPPPEGGHPSPSTGDGGEPPDQGATCQTHQKIKIAPGVLPVPPPAGDARLPSLAPRAGPHACMRPSPVQVGGRGHPDPPQPHHPTQRGLFLPPHPPTHLASCRKKKNSAPHRRQGGPGRPPHPPLLPPLQAEGDLLKTEGWGEVTGGPHTLQTPLHVVHVSSCSACRRRCLLRVASPIKNSHVSLQPSPWGPIIHLGGSPGGGECFRREQHNPSPPSSCSQSCTQSCSQSCTQSRTDWQ